MKRNGILKRPSHRKLELHRETLAVLEEPCLAGALGGATSVGTPCPTGTHCNISLCICQ